MSSKVVGLGFVSAGLAIFVYYTVWVFVLPLLPQNHYLRPYFLSAEVAWSAPLILLAIFLLGIAYLFRSVYSAQKKKQSQLQALVEEVAVFDCPPLLFEWLFEYTEVIIQCLAKFFIQ
eukprot:TRINITY_DN2517_c0_g1_i4.p2 TRINITY_DN2517_c0_g1~~TRINITY_DN2517_c0_g1_i4.p2  ORF type:complete len:118 (+),score=8.06 TRINITY_DN2517_c0_g1_i4:138-491(+)